MTSAFLAPNADEYAFNVVAVGAATGWEAMSDGSDLTYVEDPGGTVGVVRVNLSTVALPALAQMRSVTPTTRWQGGAVTFRLSDGVNTKTSNSDGAEGAFANAVGVAETTNFAGNAWTQADLDALQFEVVVQAAQVAGVFAEVVYNEAPVATPTGPASPVTATANPSVAWTYSDPESDVQERYRVRVFTEAQYTAAGFNPSTSVAFWDSGEKLSAATSVAVAKALPDQTTWRAYVRVADVGSSGRFGAWAYQEFATLYNQSPAATLIGPASPVEDTTQPVLEWTYSDPEGDLQERYRALVFDAADVGFGFDPLGAVALWDSGDVYSQDTAVQVGAPMANGSTFVAYLRVGDTTPAGSVPKWSAWATLEVEVDVATADPPTITLPVSQPDLGRVVVVVNSGALPAGVAEQTGELQRSLDGGLSWETIPGGVEVALAAVGTYATLYDYEVPRGAHVTYRARSTITNVGLLLTSEWSDATAAVFVEKGGPCVWFKSRTDPSFNVAVELVTTRLKSTSRGLEAVYEPQGRETPIVHSLGVTAEVFDPLPLWFVDDAEWGAFEALRRRTEPVLMQLPYGDGEFWEQRWVRFGDRSVTRYTTDRMTSEQWRRVEQATREVATPPVT